MARPQRVVGDQLDRPRREGVGLHDRLAHAVLLHQHRLDLGQLDAVAADLDLRVDAAEVLDAAVVAQPAEVAGAVEAAGRVRLHADEVVDEGPRRLVWPVEVTLRHADARDHDLADLAQRQHPPLVRRQDQHRVRRQRPADRHHRRRGIEHLQRRGDRRLGRPVGVEHAPRRRGPALHEVARAGFPRDDQQPQVGQVRLDRRQQRRHAAQRRDAPRDEETRQVFAEQAGAALVRVQRRADAQRHPGLLDREVEGHRQALVHLIVRPVAVGLGGDAHEIADLRLLDRHALGPPGRAGGVDDVAQRVVAAGAIRQGVGQFPRTQPLARGVAGDLVHAQSRHRQRPQPLGIARHAQHPAHPGVLADEGAAVVRKPGVERDIRRVQLEHRQHRDVAVDRLVEQQRHPVTGLHLTRGQQVPRQPVGPAVEVGVGERGLFAAQGDAVGAALAGERVTAGFEEVVQSLAGLPAQVVLGVGLLQEGGRRVGEVHRLRRRGAAKSPACR